MCLYNSLYLHMKLSEHKHIIVVKSFTDKPENKLNPLGNKVDFWEINVQDCQRNSVFKCQFDADYFKPEDFIENIQQILFGRNQKS